jgi:hypothetical protein
MGTEDFLTFVKSDAFKTAIRQACQRTGRTFDECEELQREIVERLLDSC